MAAVSSLLAALAGCSAAGDVPAECRPGRSTLSSIDPGTGTVAWVARLTQPSELPLQVDDGAVLVTAPCGAAVVDLADGTVRYDARPPGHPVGVVGDQLFTLGEPADGSIPITGIDLATSRSASSFSTNLPFQAAVVADGSLVALYGDQLEAVDETGAGPSWWVQLPTGRHPRLVPAGHLLLVTTDDGSTYAVDLADGHLVWHSIPPVPARFYDYLAPTLVPGTVLTAAASQADEVRPFVYATDAATGRLRWTRPALGVVAADPDLTVLRTATAVLAVDTTTGAVRWHRHAPRTGSAADVLPGALVAGTAVVPQRGSTLQGLDRRTGRLRWTGPEASAASAADGLVVASLLDRLAALDPGTGAVRWSRTPRRHLRVVAVGPDGQVLVLDSDIVPHLGA